VTGFIGDPRNGAPAREAEMKCEIRQRNDELGLHYAKSMTKSIANLKSTDGTDAHFLPSDVYCHRRGVRLAAAALTGVCAT
jgi:hypothetical protein